MAGRPDGACACQYVPVGRVGGFCRSGVETKLRRVVSDPPVGAASTGLATSLATLRMALMRRDTRPGQSRALSSDPSQIPGMISIGPSRYGAPFVSLSSLYSSVAALAPGRDAIEGRRGCGGAAPAASDAGAVGEDGLACCEELALEMGRESRLTLRTERGRAATAPGWLTMATVSGGTAGPLSAMADVTGGLWTNVRGAGGPRRFVGGRGASGASALVAVG